MIMQVRHNMHNSRKVVHQFQWHVVGGATIICLLQDLDWETCDKNCHNTVWTAYSLTTTYDFKHF